MPEPALLCLWREFSDKKDIIKSIDLSKIIEFF